MRFVPEQRLWMPCLLNKPSVLRIRDLIRPDSVPIEQDAALRFLWIRLPHSGRNRPHYEHPSGDLD